MIAVLHFLVSGLAIIIHIQEVARQELLSVQLCAATVHRSSLQDVF